MNRIGKKHVMSLVSLIALCIGVIHAENINVWLVDLNFCSGGNSLHLQMDAGTSTGICMQITNHATQKWTVSFGVVDGEMSQGSHPVHACKTDNSGIFGQSVTLASWPTIFELQPGETVIRTWTITTKPGFVWDMYGCTAFAIVDNSAAAEWQMFSVISRKANTISVSVSWELISLIALNDVSTKLSSNPRVGITHNADGSFTLHMNLTNKGNVSQKIAGTIKLAGWLFGDKEIPLSNEWEIYPGETKDITLQVADMPRYGDIYTLTAHINNTPVSLSDQAIPGWSLHEVATFAYGIGAYGKAALIAAVTLAIALLGGILWGTRKRLVARKKKTAKKKVHHEE